MRTLIIIVLTAGVSTTLAPAHFAPRHGWYAGVGRVRSCPGVSGQRCRQVTSWAATIPWRGCSDCLPHATVKSLPPRGVAIQVGLAVETSKPPSWMRGISWPPRVRPRDVVVGFEGLPARIGVYQRYVLAGRYEVSIRAFFGRARPTNAQLRAANAELAAARLPR